MRQRLIFFLARILSVKVRPAIDDQGSLEIVDEPLLGLGGKTLIPRTDTARLSD